MSFLLSMQKSCQSETDAVKANYIDTWLLRVAELFPKL